MMQNLVAVTGADGFIGSHLVEVLVARGHRVRAMAQYNSQGSWGWLDTLPADVLADVEVQLGDVRDPGSVGALVDGADAVCHLAALIAIPYSYQAPRSYVDTNITGTLNVLEAVKEHRTPRLVHTSTSETYGTARTVPIAETHPIQTQSPYAASKAAADKLVESYHASYGLPVVTLRPFNTYGPRQSARAFIPTVISQIAAGMDEIRVGSLTPTRDFTYVRDTAAAFHAAVSTPGIEGGVFNAGVGGEISMGDLARTIAEAMGRPEVTFVSEDARMRPDASEVMRLVCDSTRLRQATGWQPEHTLRDGLAETAAWLTGNLDRYRPGVYAL
ncbi:SDR family NAD(P)-dependent oxidoreductase [Actinocorallia sp. A-T 12471]|uniref:SDR family NAD(P)-dependent oxidoreductase n=1 Tax=Actinocorallia sp. A-T 12471 TaxID=3089813 RepID=UPI0029D315E4|nr:SDR family NAD(P)-dependent oxidoreductase [Actinocorallia sp. A-T 12471]MDX6743763.1 SDR family NAD(P)-dependent oxidoreductase [Actinocorallia sp. A-T 12471]